MKDEALRLALEALGHFEKAGLATLKTIDAITAIKQSLEQSVATNDTSQDRVDETAKQRHEPEPVAWVDLLKEAQKIVESKPLWKRFIAGTPLANDIACWMADFAQLVAQKCAEIADTAEPYQSADLIRKHFGVEK